LHRSNLSHINWFAGFFFLLLLHPVLKPLALQTAPSAFFSDIHNERRDRLMQNWYREQLRAQIPPLLAKREAILGVHAADCGITRRRQYRREFEAAPPAHADCTYIEEKQTPSTHTHAGRHARFTPIRPIV
jgi:hypothetical protein